MTSTPEHPELPPTPTQSHQPSPRTVDADRPGHTDGPDLPATTPDAQVRSPAQSVRGQVGMYELLGELARGGMGIVHKARHIVLDRVVALKMMRGDARDWPQDEQRFEREMRAAARLNHPHILSIYEIGWHEGRPFYTMPYVAGGSLAGQRAHLLADPRAAVRLMGKVARAVQCAHEQGVVHRDLKPANVLLDEQGEPLVTDFGLAKLQDDDVELTQTGAVLGTPGYMAPEQAAGRTRTIGPQTDVWSLGVMLYELLTGRRPFTGESSEDVKQQIRTADPPRPRTLNPTLDPTLESVVLRCLEKESARRYATAGELADELDRYLRGEKPLAHRDSWRQRFRQSLREHRLRSVVAVLCVAGLLAATAIFASRFTPTPNRPEVKPTPAGPDVLPEPIVLLDAGTPPGQLRWVVGEAGARLLTLPPQGPLTIESQDLNLLVLRSAPPWRRYRLEADVEDKQGGRFARAGVFFGLTRRPLGPRAFYTFWNLGLVERGHPSVKVRLDVCRLEDNPALPQRTGQFPRSSRSYDPKSLGKPPPRRLAVEVTDEKVRAFLGEDCFREATREELDRWNQGVVEELKDLIAPYSPQGGLGIFVQQGTAAFSRVVIRPLP